MPSSVHSLQDYDTEVDDELRASMGVGTRMPPKERTMRMTDPDGAFIDIPFSEVPLNGDEIMGGTDQPSSLSKTHSAFSMHSVHPEWDESQGRSYFIGFPEEDTESEAGSMPDMEMDDDESRSFVSDMSEADPIETPADEPTGFTYATSGSSRHFGSPDIVYMSNQGTDQSDDRGRYTEDGKIEEFKVTARPPDWIPEDYETGGGHGISVSPDKTTIVKRTPDTEIAFYERIQSGDPSFREIAKFTPAYKGCFTDDPSAWEDDTSTLDVSDDRTGRSRSRTRSVIKRNNSSDRHSNSIMLENLRDGFVPGTTTECDIKLGRNMIDTFAADTTPAKVEKLYGQRVNSTSDTLAARVVWINTAILDSITGPYEQIRTDKQYGMTLKRSDDDTAREDCHTFQDAIARVFPSPRNKILPRKHALKSINPDELVEFASDIERYQSHENKYSFMDRSEIRPNMFDVNSTMNDHNSTENRTRSQMDSLRPNLFELQRMKRERDHLATKISIIDRLTNKSKGLEGLKNAISQMGHGFYGSSIHVIYGQRKKNRDDAQISVNYDQTGQKFHAREDGISTGKSDYTSPFHQDDWDVELHLIDFARGHEKPGPDTDCMEGIQNVKDSITGRRETIVSHKSDMDNQIKQIRDQIMDQ